MPIDNESLLNLNNKREDDWINNDDDITINNNDIGAKAYIPPDEFQFASSTQQDHQPDTIQTDSLPHSAAQNNFEGGIFSINHYRRYFNITSDEFFSNIFSSINVLSKVELETAQETGDLYGPIWVTATVIFILFFSNTGAHKLNNWLSGSDESYEYDFALFTGAISLLYGYTVVIPIFLYVVSVFYFKLIGFLSLTKIVSIYGYANSVWAPAAILAMFRGFFSNGFISSVILWAAVLIGGGISGAAILSKLYPIIRNAAVASDNGKLKTIYLVVLILAHIGFTIGVRSILIL